MNDNSFKWAVAISWWVGGAISGILFIAFGRMLEYLEENNLYLEKNNRYLIELLNKTNT
ncbi:hypothetical protein D3C81_1376350 [compost metagenome]